MIPSANYCSQGAADVIVNLGSTTSYCFTMIISSIVIFKIIINPQVDMVGIYQNRNTTMLSYNEFSGLDFQPSLLENSNFDLKMAWACKQKSTSKLGTQLNGCWGGGGGGGGGGHSDSSQPLFYFVPQTCNAFIVLENLSNIFFIVPREIIPTGCSIYQTFRILFRNFRNDWLIKKMQMWYS